MNIAESCFWLKLNQMQNSCLSYHDDIPNKDFESVKCIQWYIAIKLSVFVWLLNIA